MSGSLEHFLSPSSAETSQESSSHGLSSDSEVSRLRAADEKLSCTDSLTILNVI